MLTMRPSEEGDTEIYIIARVFNLGQDNMGMRLYVDPASMKYSRELIFQPNSYVVTPGVPAVEEEDLGSELESEEGF